MGKWTLEVWGQNLADKGSLPPAVTHTLEDRIVSEPLDAGAVALGAQILVVNSKT
jgi:hypothetical protein